MPKKKIDTAPETDTPVQEILAMPGGGGAEVAAGQETVAAEADLGDREAVPERNDTLPDAAAGGAVSEGAPSDPDETADLADKDKQKKTPAKTPADKNTGASSAGSKGRTAGKKAKPEPESAARKEKSADGAEARSGKSARSKAGNPPQKDSGTQALVAASPRSLKARAASQRQPAGFYQTDFKTLDKDLTEPELQEWNAIYASYRSQSILTGTVIGVDRNELQVLDGETGRTELRVIHSLVIVGYRVKILIPENEVWVGGEERGVFLMPGMIGAKVDYVIINVDREGECALASRAVAMVKRRRAFAGGRTVPRPGDLLKCSVLVVGPRRCLVTCGGYDIPMRARDMSYTSIVDMKEVYRPGQELDARLVEYRPGEHRLSLSVREARPNPFDGAERRHPIGSRRQAVISGKYAGGVFCALPDGTVCMCLYSNTHFDTEFLSGDNVIVHIVEYNYRLKHIYGRIVTKW